MGGGRTLAGDGVPEPPDVVAQGVGLHAGQEAPEGEAVEERRGHQRRGRDDEALGGGEVRGGGGRR